MEQPWLRNKHDVVLGLLPVDYYAWTPFVAGNSLIASRGIEKMSGVKAKELWIEGHVGPTARKALRAREIPHKHENDTSMDR